MRTSMNQDVEYGIHGRALPPLFAPGVSAQCARWPTSTVGGRATGSCALVP